MITPGAQSTAERLQNIEKVNFELMSRFWLGICPRDVRRVWIRWSR